MVAFAVIVAASSVAVRAAGPRANPDDQMRYFWYMSERHYPAARDAGFNTFITGYWNNWYDNPEPRRRVAVDARRAFYEMLDRDGVDGIEQLKISAYRRLLAKYAQNGARDGRVGLDWNLPALREEVFGIADYIADSLSGLAALSGVQPASEVRDASVPSLTPQYVAACRSALGIDPPADVRRRAPHYSAIAGFPVSRVVSPDDSRYRYFKWFWREGDGWNRWIEEVSNEFRRRVGAMLPSFYDPFVRVPPVWGAGSKASWGAHWVYCNPQPCSVSFVAAEMQEMARGTVGQKIALMLQGIMYRNRVAPKEKKVADPPGWVAERPNATHITIAPELLREALWTLASRRLDGVGMYAFNAIFDCSPETPKDAAGYQMTNPAAFETLRELYAKVFVPLGPLLRAVPERPPEVVVLECDAHSCFSGAGSFGWGYRWGDVATLANFSPGALFEDDVAANGIPQSVKVVLAPDCDVMSKPTFSALREFQRRGGLVVADELIVPGIMPDMDLPGGLLSQYARSLDGAGDSAALRRAAAQLKRDISWKYVPYADSDSPFVFVHVRTAGDADYVFAVNDRREFGDYVGQWRMVEERGLPCKARVAVNRRAGAVYDLVRHEPRAFKADGGRTLVEVEYSTTDGDALLFTSRPLAPLAVDVRGGTVEISTPDKDVMIPFRLDRRGAKPFYGVVRNGTWRRGFGQADGVAVTCLATGATSRPQKLNQQGNKEGNAT